MPELFQVMTVDQANERLAGHVVPLARSETVTVEDALDRVLATDLRSGVDLPPFTRSTMDGFAVRAADTYGASEGLPACVTLTGEVPMGRAAAVDVGPGEAVRIHTGGMLPPGADAVVMVENTQLLDDRMLEVVRPVATGENLVPAGDDVHAGDLVFRAGHWLRPQDLGGLAGVGIATVPVVARPRVAVLATGDEIVPPGQDAAAGQIRDVNSYTIASLVRRAGGDPILCGIAPDVRAELERMARGALADSDCLVISAGSSVSTRDMTSQVIGELGQPGVLVHGVAIHPGKPTILAAADGKPVFGLPGNPVSTMVAFELFVRPVLLAMLGCEPAQAWRTVQARLAHNVASHPGREDFVPVRIEAREGGALWAEPVFGKSNLIYTMVRADGMLAVPLDLAGLYAGDLVTVRLF